MPPRADKHNLTLAAKCAPDKAVLGDIHKTGIKAVELYLSKDILRDPDTVIKTCRAFPFIYALHSPNDCFEPLVLKKLADALKAKVVVMHDIFWEDEWRKAIQAFRGARAAICVENISCVHDPAKFERRFGLKRCLDLEHLQMECIGVYEEEFIAVMKQAAHIHLTGYKAGAGLWHTPIHFSPSHNLYMLDMLAYSGYSGLVVSEAGVRHQKYPDFAALKSFFDSWQKDPVVRIGAAPAGKKPR